ncbi:hypothetical protein ACTFIR_000182 [Dictyostelium discoideum]
MALAFPPHAIQAILEIEGSLLNNRLFQNLDEELNLQPQSLRESRVQKSSINRYSKFKKILQDPIIDLEALRTLSWGGIPTDHRPLVWKLLLNYLPLEQKNHNKVLFDKRNQYKQLVNKFYHTPTTTAADEKILNQVRLDVPRTIPKGFSNTTLFKSAILHNCLERILYVWSLSNPLISYFQGLNDIPAQYLLVFLSQYIHLWGDLKDLNDDILEKVEADTFWCFSLMMNNLKNRFIDFGEGIQRMSERLKELVKLKDSSLSDHLEEERCDFVLFSIRWMICLLCREFDYTLSTRLWDSYIAHGPNFGHFHIYICAALITTSEWVTHLKQKEFSDAIVFLQHLPTHTWNICHIDYLLVRAYKIFLLEVKSLVKNSLNSLIINNNNNNENNNNIENNNNNNIENEKENNVNNNNNNNNNNIIVNNNLILNSQMKEIHNLYKKTIENPPMVEENDNPVMIKSSNINSQQQIFKQSIQQIHQQVLVSSLSNENMINAEMIEKVLEIIPANLLDFSVLSPEDADKELVKHVTMHLVLIMATLLLTSVVLLIVIITSTLTITSMEFYNNNSNKPPKKKNYDLD